MPQSMLRLIKTYNDLTTQGESALSHVLHGLRAFVGKDPKIGFYDYANLEKRILEDINHLGSNEELQNNFLLELRVFIETFERQEHHNKEDKKILYAARAAFFALARKLNYDLKTALKKTEPEDYNPPKKSKPFALFCLGTHEYFHPTPRDPIQHTMLKQFYNCCTSPKGGVDGPTDLYMGRDCTKRSYEALDAYRKARMENREIDHIVAASDSRGTEVTQRFFQRIYLDSEKEKTLNKEPLLPARVAFSKTDDPVAGWGRKSEVRDIPPNVEFTMATVATHEGRWTHSEQSTATGRGFFEGLRHLFDRFTSRHGTKEPIQSGTIMPFSGEHNHLFHGFASQGARSYVNAPIIINYCLTYDVLTRQGLEFKQIPSVVDRKSGQVIIDLQALENKNERYLEVLTQFEIMRASEEKYKEHARGEAFIYSQRTAAKIKDEFINHPEIFLNNYHEYAFSQQYALLHNYLFNAGAANPLSHDDRVKKGFVHKGYTLLQVQEEAERLHSENPELYQRFLESLTHHETQTLKEEYDPDTKKWRLVPDTTQTIMLPPKPMGSSKIRDLLIPKPDTDFEKYLVFAKDQLKKTWFETGRPKRYVKSNTPDALQKALVVSVRDVFAMINAIDKQDIAEPVKDSMMTRSLVNLVKTHSDLNYRLRQSIFEILFVRLAQSGDPFIKEAAETLRKFWHKYDSHHKKSEVFVLYLVEQLFSARLDPDAIRREIQKMEKDCYMWQGDSKKLFGGLIRNLDKHYPKPRDQATSQHSHVKLFQPAKAGINPKEALTSPRKKHGN